MVGSANLTALGLGGNKEQVASITWSSDAPENAKFFMSALAYLRRYIPADDQWFPVSLQRALRSSPWLRDDSFNPAFSTEGTEARSEEHTSELQSLMRISYAVFCLKKKKTQQIMISTHHH